MTTDPFIVFTSNIFAIMGLRAQWSLAIVGSVILVSILLSLKFTARKLERPAT